MNCPAPGGTLTLEPTDAGYESRMSALDVMIARRCLKRLERAEDLVGTAIFLASSDSELITGQTIVVDGGDIMH